MALTVGFVGLGNLGGAMCTRLVRSGFAVTAFDPSPAALDKVVRAGARAATSPAGAADGAAVVAVVVRDDGQALDAIAGPDGVLQRAAAGTVVLLHSTVAPSTVERLVAACAERDLVLLDAGISGGPDRALAGTLVAVVGGGDVALATAWPVLTAYASDVVHCGPTGAGMAAKLARNLAQYGVWCALFEGMQLAAGAGVDLDRYATYVRASGLPENHDVILGRCAVEPVDLATDPERAARLRWAAALGDKDLDDAFELAERLGLDVPIGRIARRAYPFAMGLDETSTD
jgi:3-hydroxyisobutyrate dehydrogenase